MPGFPQNVQEVGVLVDLGVIDLTTAARALWPRSRAIMGASIQAESTNTVNVLVGDSRKQSRKMAASDVYVIQVGDASNVYLRAATGTASVNVHIIVPPGRGRRS